MPMHISFLFLRLHTCHDKHLASVQCHCSEIKFDFETVLNEIYSVFYFKMYLLT